MKPKNVSVVSWGGLGDALLATPGFRAMKERWPELRLTVYCKSWLHYELYLHNPHIDSLRGPGIVSRARQTLAKALRIPLIEPNYGSLHPSLIYSKSASEIIAEMFGLELKQKDLVISLTHDEEESAKRILEHYQIPVAIHVGADFSPNKHWPVQSWEALVLRNPRYTFLQIGRPSDQKVTGTVDLRGKTSLRCSLAVVKYAKSFVGVDSVFAHATNAFGTPGVVLFGPSSPVIWGHPNNCNLFLSLRCAPCIDILGEHPCPYSTQCLKGIVVEAVEQSLNQQLRQQV
jgi:ADP-heptose:LPS heptosyltransferase